MTPEFTVSEEEEKAFSEFLHRSIREFNNRVSPHHRNSRKPGSLSPIHIILTNEKGQYIGGLTATTYWGWLDIADFYLPVELRGKGIGDSILKKVESVAILRGCTRAFLTTFEFQARSFYEKRGYMVSGELEGYPPGSTYYWMVKDLTDELAV